MMAVLEQKESIENKRNIILLKKAVFTPWSFERRKSVGSFTWRQDSESTVIGIRIKDVLLENLKGGTRYHHDNIAERISNITIQFCWVKTKDFSVHFYPMEQKIIFSKANEEKNVFFDQKFLTIIQQKIATLFREMQRSRGTITLREI